MTKIKTFFKIFKKNSKIEVLCPVKRGFHRKCLYVFHAKTTGYFKKFIKRLPLKISEKVRGCIDFGLRGHLDAV